MEEAARLLVVAAFALGTLAGRAAAEPPNADPFPVLPNKKGLQVQMLDDAISLGIHHAALNVDLTRLIAPVPKADDPNWTGGGTTFAFDRRSVDDLDRRVKPLSDRGIAVYLILLPYASGEPARDSIMLHPDFVRGGNAGPIAMFNTVTAGGRAWLTAAAEFLASRYSGRNGPHGRVWGYIAGNEVDSHWFWANMGKVPSNKAVEAYEKAVRIIHTAVRKHSANARIYLSLDHCWSRRYAGGSDRQTVPGRAFLEEFATLARRNGDFDWHLAHHPYPEPLTDCRFWLDAKNAPQAADAPAVTFRNLEVLLRFLDSGGMLWQGKPRRAILSEQGFHCAAGADGEKIQAAAYALAYAKVARLEGIDAFILHRHVDNAAEGGLKLGLWTNKPGTTGTPDRRRMMYDVFRAAGTAEQENQFAFALPVVGAKSWDEAIERTKE